jgi:DNA-binding transcriptional LysR family regulator
MIPSRMDFDQLETFLAVARLSSFSRAAEQRFRTQPAISAQIRAVEEEVGAKLLDRSGGRVSVTAAGKHFLKYVEDALEARRTVLAALKEMDEVPRGEVVVAANEATCLHVLPEVFAQFKKQYPRVGVSIRRSEHAKILDAVNFNAVDFGVVSLPVSDKRLSIVPIHREELMIMTPPGHPLTKRKSATIAEVAQFPLLLPKMGRTRDSLENIFQERQLTVNISMELDSVELMKRFVAANLGIGFIARSNIVEDVKAGVLCEIAIADAHIRRELALVYRKDKVLSRASQAFIEIAVKLKSPSLERSK